MERAGWLRSDYLSEDEIARERAHSLGVPFVVLTQGDIMPEALVMLPEPLSRAHSAVAYAFGNGTLEVAFVNLDALEHVVALHPQLKIAPRLTNQASIKQVLVQYQKYLKEKFGTALQRGESHALLLHALQSRASDIHLDATGAGTRVRYRIGGVLHEAMRLSQEAGANVLRGIKEAAKLFPIAVSQEGKFKVEHDDGVVLVSVANMPAAQGEKLTLRLASEYASGYVSGQEHNLGFTLSALGLHGKGLEQVHHMLHARAGLVLVVGKSESGKTTTLYTLLDQIRGAHLALASIEERLEYRLPHVMQTQTRPELGLTLLAGLRAVLRTDPDVLLVSNLESADVAHVALEAAARGVLVLAAVDARSSAGAIEKLLGWGVPPALLSSQLRGVIAQRVVKKLDGNNKGQQSKLTREESALLERDANFARVLATLKDEGLLESSVAWKDVPVYRAGKQSGLVGLQEVLPVSAAIKDLIQKEADSDDLEAAAREEGMLTLAEDALGKAVQGLISVEEAIEVATG